MSPYDTEEDEDLGPEDEVLDRAWSALDEGRASDALEALEELDPDWPERWIPEALACIELGNLRRAHGLIEHARALSQESGDSEGDDPDLLWARAELALREWNLEEAERLFRVLRARDENAATLDRLALLADLRGEFEAADAMLAQAHALDPAAPLPPRCTAEEFEEVVEQAVGSLPKEFRAPLETTEVVVEPVPSEWMIDREDPAGTPPDLLGLFVGASELEKGEPTGDLLPRRILLFQRNIERAVRTREELKEQIRVTLYHEIGHLLGFDEDGVAGMGLE